jgi:hypothetical protein
MKQGIWCFSTPSLDIAKSHRSNYFGWMLQGADLYSELVSSLTAARIASDAASRTFSANCTLASGYIGVPARRIVPAR